VDNAHWWNEKGCPFIPWVILDRLTDIILYYVGGCIVEIGLGKSTKVLAKCAREAGVKHYAIDKSSSRCRGIEEDVECQHDGLIIYNGLSLDFIKEFDDDPGLVFIDGCHNAKVVMQEAMFFIRKLRPGGVMFLHDTYPCEAWGIRTKSIGKTSNTYLARWELENLKNIWCFTFPYTASACGLTMVMKRPEFEHTADPLDLVGSHPRGPRMSGRYRWFMGKGE
jgi:hypothetical protein